MGISLGKMYFGMYKGKKFKDVPVDYMIWVYDNVEDIRVDLKKFLDKYIQLLRHEKMYHYNSDRYEDIEWSDDIERMKTLISKEK